MGHVWPETGRVDVPGMTRMGWRPQGDTKGTQKYSAACKWPAVRFSAARQGVLEGETRDFSPGAWTLDRISPFLRPFPLAPSCPCLRCHPFAAQDFQLPSCKGGKSVKACFISYNKSGCPPSLRAPVPACFYWFPHGLSGGSGSLADFPPLANRTVHFPEKGTKGLRGTV